MQVILNSFTYLEFYYNKLMNFDFSMKTMEIIMGSKKLNLQLSPKDIKDAVEMVPEAIERILLTLRFKIDQYLQRKKI